MTQMELECFIDAASGHISRIESGMINPTKETLDKIAQALKLNDKERALLFSGNQTVSDDEVETVIHYCKPYLEKSAYPAYLSDDRWFIYLWNDKLLEMLHVSPEMARTMKPIHELEVIFDPMLPVRNDLPKEEWEALAYSQLKHFIHDTSAYLRLHEPWLEELLPRLNQIPGFAPLWERAITEKREQLPDDERYVLFHDEGRERRYYISALNIDRYPRFNLIELIRSS